MTPETIAGLSKLRALFPDNFDILGKCLRNQVSTVRLIHLKPETSGRSNFSKIIQGIVRARIRKLFQKKFGLFLGYYHKRSDTITLNADLDRDRIEDELSRLLNIKIEPDQVYIWTLLHELGYRRGLNESGADA